MKKIKILSLVFVILLNPLILSGCWNYKELSDLGIMTGLAIDKNNKDNNFIVTFEIIDFKKTAQKDPTKSEIFQVEGKTLFDAANNAVKLVGMDLFWSHAEIVVISEQVAREGILPILDLIARDHEVRDDMHIYISKNRTASEILMEKPIANLVRSFELKSMIDKDVNLSEIPHVAFYEFLKALIDKGIEPTAATVINEFNIDKITAKSGGMALFDKDKLVGFLDDINTKYFLFTRNLIKGGLLIVSVGSNPKDIVTLQIYKSKTKVKPLFKNGKASISLNIETEVAIAEDATTEIKTKQAIIKLQNEAATQLENNISAMIKNVQQNYDTDVFGFGNAIYEENPKYFDKVDKNWKEEFKKLPVSVTATIKIRGSGALSNKIETED